MKTIKKAGLWVLSLFFLLMTLGAFRQSVLSGLMLLAAALLCNPLVLNGIQKTGRRMKPAITIPGVIVLFFAGVLTAPSSGSGETHDAATAQQATTEIATMQDTGAEESDSDEAAGNEAEAVLKEADTENPKTENPKTENPKAENPKAENPKTENPKAENPKAENPKAENPKAENPKAENPKTENSKTENPKAENTKVENSETELNVHFLDVGQGDAVLISCDDAYMLIDAGDNDKGTLVQNYLNKQGVEHLDYIIGTHPDADHIGGMDVILYKFDCGTVMMPEVTNDTATYRDVIDTMKEKGYQNTAPVVGDSYSLGSAQFTILGPTDTYEDTNNNSIVLLLTHGDNKFLFVGDAEEKAEEDILAEGVSVKADVLKVGHHGSRTASSEAFLQAVEPTYAVISCGQDNSYGHPHAETLNTLRSMGVKVFRTDEQGTVTATSDGHEISWNCAPSTTWKAGENVQSSTGTDQNKSNTANSKKNLSDTTNSSVQPAASQSSGTQTGADSQSSGAQTGTDSQSSTTQSSVTGSTNSQSAARQSSTTQSSVTGSTNSQSAASQGSTTQSSVTGSINSQSAASQGSAAQTDSTQIAGVTQENNGSNFGTAPATGSYIGNRNNHKLHRASCSYLPKEKNQVIFDTREAAVAAGYNDPCGHCNP